MGTCTGLTFVIFPPATTMRTWTGPHLVCATEPSYVASPPDPVVAGPALVLLSPVALATALSAAPGCPIVLVR